MFFGRELRTRAGSLDDDAMASATQEVTRDEVLAMITMGKQPGEVSGEELADLHG